MAPVMRGNRERSSGSFQPRMRKPAEREWQVRKHGAQGRRQWRKVHLAMDGTTSDIRAVEFTPSRDGDSPVLPELLDQIPEDEEIGTVTGDGAYDTRRCHTAIVERRATAVIPIRRNGRPWKEDGPAARAGNETLRATRHYGRAFWKRWTGYHARSRIEAKMPSPVRSNRWRSPARLKALGERIMAFATVSRTNGVPMAHPRPSDRRDPHPRRSHEPLQRPRHRRDRPRRLTSRGERGSHASRRLSATTPRSIRRPQGRPTAGTRAPILSYRLRTRSNA